MKRLTLIVGGVLIAWGALGVLNALGLIQVSVCGLFWALLFVAFGAWLIWGAVSRAPGTEEEEVAIPLEGASAAHITISHAAGRFQLQGGAAADHVVEGRFTGGLLHRERRVGDRLDVDMRVRGEGLATALLPWKWPTTRGAEWMVHLNEIIPLDVKIEGGASDNRIDLANLKVRDLRLETGASATKLTLPSSAGHTRAKVTCGAGTVEIRVPPGVAARIRARSSLGEAKVDRARFPAVSSGVYESPDYESATDKVELMVEASLGSAEVR
jgi:hypothetical protein